MTKRLKNSLKFITETENFFSVFFKKLKSVEKLKKIKHFSEILKGRINYS